MKVFFDTNILIDAFSHRDDESKMSQKCFELVAAGQISGYINAKQLTDFHYLLYKTTHNKSYCEESIKTLCEMFEVVPFTKYNLLNSILNNFNDFEDGTIDDSARLFCCDFILTRNEKDFKKSHIKTISPRDFVILHNAISNS